MSLFVRSANRNLSAPVRRVLTLILALSMAVAACGSDGTTSEGAAEGDTSSPDSQEDTGTDDEEHDDEEHDDEDHDDEDHDDEDHEDHDDEDRSSGLAAHEHGVAELNVAWTDSDVVVELVTPAFNVFGFEYEPETDEDIELAEERSEALTAPGLIAFNDEAACALSSPPATEIEREGSHSEITVSWLFSCEEPAEISELDAAVLFDEFPNFEDIDAQWVSATDQSSAELSSESPVLRLES